MLIIILIRYVSRFYIGAEAGSFALKEYTAEGKVLASLFQILNHIYFNIHWF